MPWNVALRNQPTELKEGKIALLERPGSGFSFDKAAIKSFHVR
jgi:L-alanine-DL-glutamate epimerase-like enolase superfamily enzyme